MARRWTKAEEDEYREVLTRLYTTENKTIREIAPILNIKENSVYDRLLRLGISPCRSNKVGFNRARSDIHVPTSYTTALAEFVGIMLGDGNLSHTQVMVTLGSKERDYVHYVAHLMESLFKVSAKTAVTKHGYRYVYIGSTRLVRWFLAMGLVHNKVKEQVRVPVWIMNDNTFKAAALRGLFDTDGSVYKLRHGVQISFCNKSIPLLHDVRAMLIDLEFHPSVALHNKVYLTRKEDILKYYAMIGFANRKHRERYHTLMGLVHDL